MQKVFYHTMIRNLIMKVTNLNPKPTTNQYFDFIGSNLVPKAPGCYALCRSDGLIFYIGQAHNLQSRIKQHLKNPKKTNMTKIGTASLVFYLKYPQERLNALENTWIQQYKNEHCGNLPLFNKVEAPTKI